MSPLVACVSLGSSFVPVSQAAVGFGDLDDFEEH